MDFKADVSYSSSPETPIIGKGTSLDKNISNILSFLESPLAPTEDADLPDTQPVHILKGVVAFVEVRTGTENRSKAICRELINMGASVEPKFTNDVTHVVFKDGRKSTLDRAIKKGIHVVSVLWVDSCKQNQEHVLERLFPAAQPETKGTPIMVARLKKSKSMQPKDFDEEVANSAEKNVKNRKRLASKAEREERYRMILESPSVLNQGKGTPTLNHKPSFLVSETCPKSPEMSMHYRITVPDTPPSMRERMSHMMAKQHSAEPARDLITKEEEPITDTPQLNVAEDDIAVLQRRLFGMSETEVDNEDPLMLNTSLSQRSIASTSIQHATSPYVKSLISQRKSPKINRESPKATGENHKRTSQCSKFTNAASNFGIRQGSSPLHQCTKTSIPHGIKKQARVRRSKDPKELNKQRNEALGDTAGMNESNSRQSSENNEVPERGKSIKKKKLMKINLESPCSQLISPSHEESPAEESSGDASSLLLGENCRRKVKAKHKGKKKSGSSRDPNVLFTCKEIPETSKNADKKRKKRSSIVQDADNDVCDAKVPKKRSKPSYEESDTCDEVRLKSPVKVAHKASHAALLVPESVETDHTFVPESLDMMEGITCVADSEAPDADQVTVVPETVPEDYDMTYLDEEDMSVKIQRGRRKSHTGNRVDKVLPVRGRRRSEILRKSALCDKLEKDKIEGSSLPDDNSKSESQPPAIGELDTPKTSTAKASKTGSLKERRKSCIHTPNINDACKANQRRKSVVFSDAVNTGEHGLLKASKSRRKSVQTDTKKSKDESVHVQVKAGSSASKTSNRRKSESAILGKYTTDRSKDETGEQNRNKSSNSEANKSDSGTLCTDTINTSEERKARRRSSAVVVTKLSDTDESLSKKVRRRSCGVSTLSSSSHDSLSSGKARPVSSNSGRSLGKTLSKENLVCNTSDISPEIALQAPLMKKINNVGIRRRSVRFSNTTENLDTKSSPDLEDDSLTDISALTTQNHTLTPSGRTKELLPVLKNRRRSGRLVSKAAKQSDTSYEGNEMEESVEEPRLTSTPGRSLSEGLSTEEIALQEDDTSEDGGLSKLSSISHDNRSVFASLTSSRRSIEEFVTAGRNHKKKPGVKVRACSLPMMNNGDKMNNKSRRHSESLTGNKVKISEKKSNLVKKMHKSESEARKNNDAKSWKKVAIESKNPTEPNRTLVTTNLHFDEQDLVSSVVKRLGGFIMEESVNPATTHVVSGRNRRTLNILYAMAKGLWVLSLEWVFKSLEAGKWLDEEAYEVDYFPAVKLSRVERGLEGVLYCPHLFTEEGAIYVSDHTAPPRKHLVKLIKLCGGKVTVSQKQASVCIGMVSTEDILSLSEQWVLDSICQMSTVKYYAYKLSCPSRMEREPSPDY